MSYQLFIGLMAEGSTDVRFLKSIVSRTFEAVAFDCPQDVEIEVNEVPAANEESDNSRFVDSVIAASARGVEMFGIRVLCCHTDADSRTDQQAFARKISPAIEELSKHSGQTHCKVLTPIVPVRMMEAWMLADKQLLKDEIGTDLSDAELGFARSPESVADPKRVIQEAIAMARSPLTKKRRRDLDISELYQPIGLKVPLVALESLPSYVKFKASVHEAFVQLNLLY